MSYSTNLKIQKIKEIISNSCNGIGKYRYDFKQFNECAYRSIIAVCLNNFIDAKVSIEEQVSDGSSDISIRLEKNKDFVIECKIWDHKNKIAVERLQNAFNQLIRYSPQLSENYFSIIIFNTFFKNNNKKDDCLRNQEFYEISKSMINHLQQITNKKNIVNIEEISLCSWLMIIKHLKNQKETEIFICFCDCPNKIKTLNQKPKIKIK